MIWTSLFSIMFIYIGRDMIKKKSDSIVAWPWPFRNILLRAEPVFFGKIIYYFGIILLIAVIVNLIKLILT